MTKYAFFEGEIVPIEEAKVSIMTHALNYGTGAFAGIRGYWNEEQEQLYVFRMLDHYRRFIQSGKYLLAQMDYTPEQLVEITVELLKLEGWRQDCYIRPLLYKADTAIGIRIHDLRDAVAIFTLPFGKYIQDEEGAKVCTSSWRRVDDTAIPARGKLTGSYINSALIKTEAMLNGFDEGIVLNQNGQVAEGSAENLFIVREGRLITTPVYSNILEGITRRTIMHLAQEEMNVEVEERPIDRSELYVADEAFFCGTGVQIVAIASVDHRPVGEGRIGPITRRIRDLYFRIVRGQEPKYRRWLTPVPKT
ncbi:MAG: branched-chain amino acid transaminase [Chloroflexi bacterium]|nr:branched-chain amino acid transaminase [Chloroflexota bacterium]